MSNPENSDASLGGRRLVLFGMAMNFVLAVVKVTAGVLGRSQALVADGIESSMDVLSSLMIWGALKVSIRPPDREHPYGHGKVESLAAVFGALALLAAGGVIAWQSGHTLWKAYFTGLGAPETPAPYTLAVILLVIVIKELLSRRVLSRATELQSRAMEAEAWHHRSDAMTSAAAFLGILLTQVGGPALATADSWAALFSCGIILYNGAHMFRNAVGEVIDEQGSADLIRAVVQAAEAVPGVRSTEKCRVRKSGLTRIADLHVRVDGGISVEAGHDIAHEVVEVLRKGGFQLSDVTVHIEPERGAAGSAAGENQRANDGGSK